VLYGTDPRPVDGAVLQVEIDGRRIEIGGPCAGTAGCLPIPSGVAALGLELTAITDQIRATEPSCAPLR
jgi:hypothetical protein